MRHWCASLIASTVLLISRLALADDHLDVLARLENQIESLKLASAREQLDALDPTRSDSPRVRYLQGKLLFYEGRYNEALDELRAAIEGARAELGWKLLRDRIELTREALAGLKTKPSGNGKFVFRYRAGPDSVLLSYAEQTLNAQLAILAEELDDLPRRPIEVDLLPDVETLAAASGLTVEQIERTGTVGVTKHGKIMVLTPREVTTGYPWLDTLAHELTHVAITRASRGRAPIWLHEGIAKLYELRWRGEKSGLLSPEEAYLLDRAARERRLIPLRRFHPSIAHLPNQEDATLAYAQVLSFLAYLDGRLGDGWIRELLENIANGQTVDKAFIAVTRFPIRRNYLWWRQTASGKRQTPMPAVGFMKRRFKRGATTMQSGLESMLNVDVRRHLRVGDLLRLRGHVRAATAEFRQALALTDSPSPVITDRLASCLLELGTHEEVVDLLTGIVRLYPSHAETYVQLGAALAALKRPTEAIAALERGNAVNPFHPAVHCMLVTQYRALGREPEAQLESDHCRLLAVRGDDESQARSDAVD